LIEFQEKSHQKGEYMRVENVAEFGADAAINADLVIIGGGPAGLTIAREFFGSSTEVLVLESGQLTETPRATDLNTVESIGEPKGEAQTRRRIEWHGSGSSSWSPESQPYGVRCRVLGGSSHAWAGKVAAFDVTDFSKRDWIPYSGWPITPESLTSFVDRAAVRLNLGPNCYDSEFWTLLGLKTPPVGPDSQHLQSFFWQIARSRLDSRDIMRFGPEFVSLEAPNVRVLVNATVTSIDTNEEGSAFESLEVSTIDGVRLRVRAKAAVLAASGIENPRLLLASRKTHPQGLGNAHDLVGRFLMDHLGAKVGSYKAADCPEIGKRFGFYSIRHQGQAHIYMHGLTPSIDLQQREALNNCAIYMMEEWAPDDPWSALKRLSGATSDRPISDVLAVASSPGLLLKGAAMRIFESDALPESFKRAVINTVISQFPNFAVREFRTRSLPHKIKSIAIEGIAEQRPDPESRITLSETTDALGIPRARVNWRDDGEARRSLARLGRHLLDESLRIDIPVPQLEDWVVEQRHGDGIFIDSAHTAGTTRMSDDPKQGVVDSNCRLHGVTGLYVAGASVFPTSGHANPTLMILALAIRLADRIKLDLERQTIVATSADAAP
jgi:choline dehydrogenase-like flavoprotein